MKPARELAPTPASPPAPAARRRSIARAVLLHGLVHPLVALAAFGAYEHFKLQGQAAPAYASLAAAAGFGLAPVRALAHELLAIEGALLHLVHGVGGLAVVGLSLGGVISGGPIVDHAATAPFAIMGAAQALMHADHPRNREEAEAMRRFVSSFPELRQVAAPGALATPANARRAVAVLTDLVAKAQALGEVELRSDPGFQSALRRTTARLGLSLGLDSIDRAIARLPSDPGTASAASDLRRRVAALRRSLDDDAPAAGSLERDAPDPDAGDPRRAARRARRAP